MMAQWFYMMDSQAVGPVSYERIKQLADAGILTPDSAVRYEEGEWQMLAELPGVCGSPTQTTTQVKVVDSQHVSHKWIAILLGGLLIVGITIVVLWVVFDKTKSDTMPIATTNASRPLSDELMVFRDSLIKLRSDLKIGLTDSDYLDALRSQQYAFDKASASPIEPEHREIYRLLQSAFNNYLAAGDCIDTILRPEDLPSYASVIRLENEYALLEQEFAVVQERYIFSQRHSGALEFSEILERTNAYYGMQSDMLELAKDINAEQARVLPAWNAEINAVELKKEQHWAKASSLLDQAIALGNRAP